MRCVALLIVILSANAVRLTSTTLRADETATEPAVKLWEWGKGIAVESMQAERMTVYLWFYEWNMFDARAKGQHTRGSHDGKRTVSPDGRTAVIDTSDMQLTARAVDDGAELTLEITNRTGHTWPEVAGIIPCFNPGAPSHRAKQYPKAMLNARFDNTNTWYAGKNLLKKLIGRDIHFNARLRKQVDRKAKGGRFVFSDKWPTSPDDAHAGLIVRESNDGRWVTGIAWERFLSAQGHNPWSCMHLGVNVGPLKPKESRTIRGRIYLFPGTRNDAFERFGRAFAD